MQPQSNTFAGALADNAISKAIVSEDKPKEITSVSDAPPRWNPVTESKPIISSKY